MQSSGVSVDDSRGGETCLGPEQVQCCQMEVDRQKWDRKVLDEAVRC